MGPRPAVRVQGPPPGAVGRRPAPHGHAEGAEGPSPRAVRARVRRERAAVLSRVARLAVRRPRLVLAGSVLFRVAAALRGGGVAEHLTSGGFENPRSESFRTAEHLREDFGVEDPNLVLLVRSRTGTVDDPAVTD